MNTNLKLLINIKLQLHWLIFLKTLKYFYRYNYLFLYILQPLKIALFFLFFSQFVIGQGLNSKIINGKVSANYPDLDGVYILNLTSNAATLTANGGYFIISATVGDTLQVSALQFIGKKIILEKENFGATLLVIKLETAVTMLDEVKISQFKKINSVSLGLVSKNQRKYTPAERKLKAAGQFHWYSPLLIPFGGMSVDGLLNAVSGKTSQLKKELIIERKELLLKKIDILFQENHFLETLKIPAEHVAGFKYYIVEDEKFVAAINNKNKTMAAFLMGELAVNYLKFINP